MNNNYKNVLATLPIGENTAVLVECSRFCFENVKVVKNEKGNSFELLSVGTLNFTNVSDVDSASSILVLGNFEGKKIYLNNY